MVIIPFFIVLAYGQPSADCISQIANSSSIANAVSFLKYSGKGVNELGKFEACNRSGQNYVLLGSIDSVRHPLKVGLCLPKACSVELMNSKVNALGLAFSSPTSESLSFLGYLYLTVLIFLLLASIVSTYIHYKNKKTQNHIVKCFSLILAFQNLMKVRLENRLGCLNFIKVYSFVMVLYGHCYVLKLSSSIINLETIPDIYLHWWGVLGYSGFFAVDIFFWITGFLLSYFLLIELMKRNEKISWGAMYIHRVLRILPTFAMVLGFNYFVLPVLGSGPVWDNYRKSAISDCDKYWWTTFLFVNNFIPDGEGNGCFGIGWYLANDMQFFLVGPFLVYLYYKIPQKNWVWGLYAIIIAFCAFITYNLAYKYHLRVNIMDPLNLDGEVNVWFTRFYTKPYIRFPPNLQGIIAGILFLNYQRVEKGESINDKLSEWIVAKITHGRWIGLIAMVIGVVFMYFSVMVQQPAYEDFFNSYHYSDGENAIILATNRITFILGTMMFIIPILMQKAKFLEEIMSFYVFEILAKISYCGFLVHFGIMLSYYSSQSNTALSGAYVFRDILTILPLTVLAGLFVYLFIEIPFQNLEGLLFKRK